MASASPDIGNRSGSRQKVSQRAQATKPSSSTLATASGITAVRTALWAVSNQSW